MLFSFVVFASCSAQINGSIKANGQAELYISASLEPRIISLLGRFAEASGTAQPETSFLDGPDISASFAKAPGVAFALLKNVSKNAIEGPVTISQIQDLLKYETNGSGVKHFIHFVQQSPSAPGRCSINLDLESGPELLALISPDISDYLSALMAPIATGERLSKSEYLLLVASVYGKGIADEISKAAVKIAVDFPGQVQSVSKGSFSGKKAECSIPLLEILVLEQPFNYEAVWK